MRVRVLLAEERLKVTVLIGLNDSLCSDEGSYLEQVRGVNHLLTPLQSPTQINLQRGVSKISLTPLKLAPLRSEADMRDLGGLRVRILLAKEGRTYKTLKAIFWPWLSG